MKPFDGLVSGKIAIDDIPKRQLAKEVDIPANKFGEMLRGYAEMPYEARVKLIEVLGLEAALKRLNARGKNES